MKDWKKALIAFGPLLLGLWLVIGYLDNFKTATICIGTGIAVSAVVAGWIYFVFHILDE
jgi:hypothetical protein